MPDTQVLKTITINQTTLEVVVGDITSEELGAITNAANEELWLGGGVAGAINSKAGIEVDLECKAYIRANGKVPISHVMVTGPGRLKCAFVIHAVGPTYRQGQNNEELLTATVLHVLEKANELCAGSVSLPAISSGIYGFPKHECAEVMFSAFCTYMETHPETNLRSVRFINYDMSTVRTRQVDYFTIRFDMMRPRLEALSSHLQTVVSAVASNPPDLSEQLSPPQ